MKMEAMRDMNNSLKNVGPDRPDMTRMEKNQPKKKTPAAEKRRQRCGKDVDETGTS